MSEPLISLRYRSERDGSLQDVSTVSHVQHIEEEGLYRFYMATAHGDRGVLTLPSSEVIPVSEELFIITRDIASDPLVDLEELDRDLDAPLVDVPYSQGVKFPVIEEKLKVHHRIKPTGTLRVEKHVDRTTEQVETQRLHQEAVVERRPCERVLEQGEDAPHYTLEDGSLVIPVVEERAIVTVERVVVEEVVVRKVTHVDSASTRVELRRAHVDTTYEILSDSHT